MNDDGEVDISDLAALFEWLAREDDEGFCRVVGDVNGDGRTDYSDTVYLGLFIFADGSEPVPFPPEVTPCVEPVKGIHIRRVEGSGLSPTSAMAGWETPVRASTLVRYGTNPEALDKTVNPEERTFYHEALLKDLSPGTTYYYQGESESSDGVKAVSEVQSIRTPDELTGIVLADHPRLLLNSELLTDLRRSLGAKSIKQQYWEDLTQWCNAKLQTPVRNLAEDEDVDIYTRAFAFAALLSGNRQYRFKAFEIALYIAEKGVGGELRGGIEALAYVYDWLHDEMPEGLQKQVLSRLVRSVHDLESLNRDDEFVTGHSHGNQKSILIGALAAHGDDPLADKMLDTAVRNYRHGFLATWRRFAGSDGGSSKGWWYTSYTLPFEVEFFAAWRSATGEDLFKTERYWCEGLLDWFVYGMRGDNTFLREGDNHVFNGLNFQDRHFTRLLAKEYGNSTAQWFAGKVADVTPVWGPHAVLDILWTDPEVEATEPAGSTTRHFRNAGVVIMKESWKRDSVLASFRSAEAYTLGHTHRDNCSFTLFYKGPLAIDSGIYDDFGSKHYRNYYSRSVAHNTITVFDPNEEFVLYGDKHSNDGGQRWLLEGTDVENHWPATAEDTIDRDAGYRLGGITHHEDTEEYTYTVGNGGPAYSRTKVKRFLRHFLWLKKVNGWQHPVSLVFDDVASTKPIFKKKYLLHTEGQPIVKGPLVSVTVGQSKLFHVTLAPEAAVLTTVGGPGQEFWVNGANYPPVRTARDNEEAGRWRLEVSPPAENREDRFLHALYPAEAADAAPAPAASFAVGPMQLCELAQWTVLFDVGSLPDNFEYPNRRPETSHLVFGTVPGSPYEIYVNDAHAATATASFSGALRFDVEAVGKVRLERVKA